MNVINKLFSVFIIIIFITCLTIEKYLTKGDHKSHILFITNLEIKKRKIKDNNSLGTKITSISQADDIQASQTDRVGQNVSPRV